VPGSRRFRWVEVPLDPRPWVDIQHVGVIAHGPEDVDKGFPKRARSGKRRRQPREDLSSLSCRKTTGGQGARREVRSEGLEEKHRVVIDGSHPDDEPVGQRRGMVEPRLMKAKAYGFLLVAPRCVRATRWGRDGCDPGRPGIVQTEGKVEIVWHRRETRR
jgi:hypothetical protein